MVLQLILPLEHYILVIALRFLTREMALCEVLLQVFITIVEDIAMLLVTKVTRDVVLLQVLEEDVIVEEVCITKLRVIDSIQCSKGGRAPSFRLHHNPRYAYGSSILQE
jgi:hypothetical protein